MELKSKDNVFKICEDSDFETGFKKCQPLDFSKAQALPDIRHVLSRRWTILAELPLRLDGRANKVKKVLAEELWYDWVYMNVPPVHVSNIIKKLDQLFTRVDILNRTRVEKRGPSWRIKMEKLRDDLNNGFDIRSYHQNVIDWISEEFGVEVGEDEDLLHEDNCIPIDGKCPRKRICSGVDHVWLRDAMERQAALEKKEEYAERKVTRIKNDQEALKKMKASASNKSNESAEMTVRVLVFKDKTAMNISKSHLRLNHPR